MRVRIVGISDPLFRLAGLLALVGGACFSQQPLQVIDVGLVASAPAARTEIDYTYRVTVRNAGVSAAGVTAQVRSASAGTSVVEDELEFGDIPAGQAVTSRNTFTIRQKQLAPPDLDRLSYVFRVGAGNAPPIADAGDDQVVRLGQAVRLDGSRSEDPDGSIARYSWSYAGSSPAGLPASLLNPGDVAPAVRLSAPGTYAFRLTVTDDSGVSSAWDEVRIQAGPVARPGPDQTVRVGMVQLDGSASFDPDHHPLQFSWKLSRPPGSNARLSDANAARPSFVADVAGNYRAVLTVNGGGGASEPAAVDVIALAPDVPLVCGDLISGSIDAAGEVDRYRFTGEVNRIVTVTLAITGGFAPGTTAAVRVLGPSGQVLLNYVAANVQRQLALPEAGAYLIDVVGGNFTATGQYALGLECRNPAAVVNAALPCGALVHGSLTAIGQVDQFAFAGQVNRQITLTLANTGGFAPGTTSYFSLFAPSGQVVLSFVPAYSQRQVTLTEAGTYVVQVVGHNFTATGQYALGRECRNPAAVVNATLPCGGLVQGNLTAVAQVDQYTFAGQVNRQITLTLANTGGFAPGTTSYFSLFAPSGQVVLSFVPAYSQRQVTLTEAGTYVVQVVGHNFAATGRYALGRECRNPAAVVNATLDCGSLLQGNLTAVAQVDQYTFAGQVNRQVTLTLANTAGFAPGTTSYFSLFAPSGKLLLNFVPAYSQRQVTLPEAGTYVVQVVGGNFSATGRYALGLECRNPVALLNATLPCGGLVQGSLTAIGQVDQYAFAGQVNRQITLTLANTGGFAPGTTSYFSLFAPSGQVVLSFVPAYSQRQVTLAEAGTYVVQVVGGNFSATGQYALGRECRNPAAVVNAPLACGSLVHGSLTAAAQVDQYTFPGQVNMFVTLTLANTSGFPPGTTSYFSLFAPSGQLLLNLVPAGSQRQVKLAESGTYVVQVVGHNFSATGQYNIGLQCP